MIGGGLPPSKSRTGGSGRFGHGTVGSTVGSVQMNREISDGGPRLPWASTAEIEISKATFASTVAARVNCGPGPKPGPIGLVIWASRKIDNEFFCLVRPR